MTEYPQTPLDDWKARPFASSPEVANLFFALSAAQGEFRAVESDKENKHLKSRYASLGAYLDAIRAPLAKHGLAVMQFTTIVGDRLRITTVLAHESGEWISNDLGLPIEKVSLQGIGTAMTYGRRYSLTALIGLAQYDDDGAAVLDEQVADALTDEETTDLHKLATELFGDDADEELARVSRLLFRVGHYAQIPPDKIEVAKTNLRNKAKANSKAKGAGGD